MVNKQQACSTLAAHPYQLEISLEISKEQNNPSNNT
jgi:hypothetical protein